MHENGEIQLFDVFVLELRTPQVAELDPIGHIHKDIVRALRGKGHSDRNVEACVGSVCHDFNAMGSSGSSSDSTSFSSTTSGGGHDSSTTSNSGHGNSMSTVDLLTPGVSIITGKAAKFRDLRLKVRFTLENHR